MDNFDDARKQARIVDEYIDQLDVTSDEYENVSNHNTVKIFFYNKFIKFYSNNFKIQFLKNLFYFFS